ncbi:MAG: pimeloyl-ACP methyl ester esterase BioH [Pseudomonadales bacterium]|nr:pimeloyl-ACP methyl ester esterase BioH [Pseudomonadales bacterium]
MSLVPYHDVFLCTNRKLKEVKNLVLLHGWGLHSGLWDSVMPELLEQFNVTVIDLPGMGRSPLPSGNYDLRSICEQVLQVAPNNAVWLGWSLGGLVALKIAADHPDRVTGLVNIGSTPKFCKGDDWPEGMAGHLLDRFSGLVAEDWRGALIRFLALQCKDSDSYGEDVSKLKELMLFHGQPAQQALRQGLIILRDADLRSELQSLTVPSLYLFGENDNVVSRNMVISVEALNEKCCVVVVRGAGHIPSLSHPESFLRALGDFISERLA